MERIILIIVMVWFFSSCANPGDPSAGQVSNEEDMLIYGKKIYQTQCIVCHGEAGNAKIAQASDLTISKLNETSIGDLVYHGKRAMPAFKDRLGEPEILAVSKYVLTLKKSK